jgi:YHS domain-containing protein
MKKLLIGFILTFPIMLFGQKPSVFSTKKGAIQGYDPVAYFTLGKEVKGTETDTLVFQNATWHFADQANLNLFKTSPEKYMPQFGGYCAFGMSRGYKAETQPNAWTIVEGKLYLNYNTDVRQKWNEDQAGFIQKANENWAKVKQK